MLSKQRTNQEEKSNEQLVALIRAGDHEADNMLALWLQNERFVYKLALKYQESAEKDDLIQEGYMGICEAVCHYNTDFEVPFINYAAFWIKHAMRRFVDNNSSCVRLPLHAQDKVRKLGKAVKEYQNTFGKNPTNKELERLLDVNAEQLDMIRKNANVGKMRSLSEPLGDDRDTILEDTIQSDYDLEEDTGRYLDHEAMRQTLWSIVDELPGEQQKIIYQRYAENKSMVEIAEESKEEYGHIRNEEAKAIRFLRHPKRSKKYKAYYESYLSAVSFHHVGLEQFKNTWTSEVEWEVLSNITW